MDNRTKKQIKDKCINICKNNDKEKSIELIKKEFPDCAIDLDFHYSNCGGMKMFMGMMLWRNFSISF